MSFEISRRTLLQGAGAGAFGLALTAAVPAAARADTVSQRAIYHMTPPTAWLCDPQRPIVSGGQYQLYYLHSNINNGPGGWDHATTDGVSFTHHGTVMPISGGVPVWSGCLVVDTGNTAGFGAGAVIALATRPTNNIRKYQEQYLYWSTDGGFSFTMLPDPVLVNNDGRTAQTPAEIDNAEWCRDPKVHWDAGRSEWVLILGRARYAGIYTSPDLRNWTWRSNFDYPNHDLGGIECPDIFQMTAGDGTSHWVIGASMDAYGVGLPMTYAYWTGTWNGTHFVADDLTPQWLDWGGLVRRGDVAKHRGTHHAATRHRVDEQLEVRRARRPHRRDRRLQRAELDRPGAPSRAPARRTVRASEQPDLDVGGPRHVDRDSSRPHGERQCRAPVERARVRA
jgi:levanbiose-producing levanase